MPKESFKEHASLRGIHILLVVDEAESGELLRAVLEDAGALVTVAAAPARSALPALEAIQPDVLVADVGDEADHASTLIARVRAMPGCEEIPSIAVTAGGGREARQRLLTSGYQEHVARPVDVRELCRLVALLAARRG
jgi:CheY-like chemotaxis protein